VTLNLIKQILKPFKRIIFNEIIHKKFLEKKKKLEVVVQKFSENSRWLVL